jgi:hypothetical protein
MYVLILALLMGLVLYILQRNRCPCPNYNANHSKILLNLIQKLLMHDVKAHVNGQITSLSCAG